MKQFYSFRPAVDQLDIDISQLIGMAGDPNIQADNPIMLSVNEIFGKLTDISDIRGGYSVYDVEGLDIKSGNIYVDGESINVGRQICSYLKDSEKIAFFICTAGENFTELRYAYDKEGDYLNSYFLDSLGSIVVEKAMDYIQKCLELSMASEDCCITNRYSPGYCNWNLSEQKKIFGFVPADCCNISLSNSSLMLPIKSVSGIIGIGANVKKKDYGCKICKNVTCSYLKFRAEG